MGFGQVLGNAGRSLADITLSTVGMNNVISDSDYKGKSATDFRNVADVGGKITSAAAPIAAGLLLGPAGAAGVTALQHVGGSMNPQQTDMTQADPVQTSAPTLSNYDQSLNYAHGGYVRGSVNYTNGIKGYADGDFVTPNPFAAENGTPLNVDTTQGNFGSQNNFNNNFGNPGLTGAANHNLANAAGLNPYIAGGTLALGLLQAGMGYSGLKKLQKEPLPQLSVSPQLQAAYGRAQQATKMGYTPEQTAAFKQNLATSNNTAYSNALNQSGGNLAGAINAGIQSQNINALNQFSAQDSQLKRENQKYADSFASQFQDIQDENMREALKRRMAREQALGQATASGLNNLASAGNLAMASSYKG